MVIKCDDVWREISNYLDGDLDPELKRAMDEHFAQCRQCVAVRDGVRNIVDLYGSERMFTLPAGFHPRLRSRLDDQIEGQRGSSRGLLVSLAAAAAIAALFFIATAHSRFAAQPRAQMSQPVRRVPQELVAVVDGGKTFHRPGCRYMHGKYRMVTPEKAIREGYSPCVYCMHEALQSAGNADPDLDGEETASNATAEK
jgi:hypothetical protein